MSEIASAIESSVETQDVTALQISNNVKQAVRGARQVTAGISDVNKEASNTGQASEGVLASDMNLPVGVLGHARGSQEHFVERGVD